jgi:hypothetical protein
MTAYAGSRPSLESRVRCATKQTDAMDNGPIAHSKWAMGLWSVALGEVPDGERAAPILYAALDKTFFFDLLATVWCSPMTETAWNV